MNKTTWKEWRFACPLFSYIHCNHPLRRHDHENRCYCQSHKEAYNSNENSQSSRSYDSQADAINEHAWEQCPLKSFTPELAEKEALKQKIQLQIACCVQCTEDEINARLKLKEMKATFEEKYHEKS